MLHVMEVCRGSRCSCRSGCVIQEIGRCVLVTSVDRALLVSARTVRSVYKLAYLRHNG